MKKFNEREWLKYRAEHPEMRFWQALRNYMDVANVYLTENDEGDLFDTFYLGDN